MVSAETVVSTIQLIQWKHAVKLEKLGLKHSSGKSLTAYVKRIFGLPRSTKHDDIVEMLESLIKEQKDAR